MNKETVIIRDQCQECGMRYRLGPLEAIYVGLNLVVDSVRSRHIMRPFSTIVHMGV